MGTFIHCWWECKMVQTLWNTVWQFPTCDLTNYAPWYLTKLVENLYVHKIC
jgi:hypothetical protein